jgi:hypothetical protein
MSLTGVEWGMRQGWFIFGIVLVTSFARAYGRASAVYCNSLGKECAAVRSKSRGLDSNTQKLLRARLGVNETLFCGAYEVDDPVKTNCNRFFPGHGFFGVGHLDYSFCPGRMRLSFVAVNRTTGNTFRIKSRLFNDMSSGVHLATDQDVVLFATTVASLCALQDGRRIKLWKTSQDNIGEGRVIFTFAESNGFLSHRVIIHRKDGSFLGCSIYEREVVGSEKKGDGSAGFKWGWRNLQSSSQVLY